jgi:hypothetical protein
MQLKRSHLLKLFLATGLAPIIHPLIQPADAAATPDPLPSWQDSPVKAAIVASVQQATTEGGAGYIPPRDRIATFDNDGTLWCEQPLGQGVFIVDQLKAQLEATPALATQPVIVAILEGDKDYFAQPDALAELVQVLGALSANMPQAEFDRQAVAFLETATHPQFNVHYTEMGYLPQVELLTYLRANGFQTWICSGGGIDFIRLLSEAMYGIVPQQVIGSSLEKDYRQVNGEGVIWRLPDIDLVNDKEGKPVGIDRAIGQPPVFACGNVRSGGDIAMLTYSQSAPYPSFQLLINHDDAVREFAYSEPDNASLNAARQNGWQVVSMKTDWKTIFSWQ